MALFGKKKEASEQEEAKREPTPPAGGASPAASGATPTAKPETAQSARKGSEPTSRAEAGPVAGAGLGRTSRGGTTPAGQSKTNSSQTNKTGGDAVASIGKSIIIKGELTGSEDLEIDGTIEGDVKLPDHELTIGSNGRVTASINAKCVRVVGHVTGNIAATERVEIETSGIVEGDIRAPRLLVQEGAVVNGAIEMSAGGAKTASKPPAPKPESEPERKAG